MPPKDDQPQDETQTPESAPATEPEVEPTPAPAQDQPGSADPDHGLPPANGSHFFAPQIGEGSALKSSNSEDANKEAEKLLKEQAKADNGGQK